MSAETAERYLSLSPFSVAKQDLGGIASFYDQEAVRYDQGYSSPICRAEDWIVAHHLQEVIGDHVLDVGCGTGNFLGFPGCQTNRYLGLELSRGELGIAKGKFPDGCFVQADMNRPPFPDGSFDSIVSLYGPFSYALTPEELVQEFWRLLRPGGKIAIMPYSLRTRYGLFVGDYSTATEPTISKIFYTTEELEHLFGNFENLKVRGIDYLANVIEELKKRMGLKDLDREFYEKLLRLEDPLAELVPAEYARHILVTARKSS